MNRLGEIRKCIEQSGVVFGGRYQLSRVCSDVVEVHADEKDEDHAYDGQRNHAFRPKPLSDGRLCKTQRCILDIAPRV